MQRPPLIRRTEIEGKLRIRERVVVGTVIECKRHIIAIEVYIHVGIHGVVQRRSIAASRRVV